MYREWDQKVTQSSYAYILYRKRIKSARIKDSKAKSTKSTKTTKKVNRSDTIASNNSTKNMKSKTMKKDSIGKIRNNFMFNNDVKNKQKNPSSKQLQEILSMNGLSDINFKKQMLISKIKQNDAAHDKYMKVKEGKLINVT